MHDNGSGKDKLKRPVGGRLPSAAQKREPKASARPAVCDSVFDPAMWLLDKALDSNEYLQPMKLHRLLFLAQAYFAVANYGRKLMPAVFVADDTGPLEPNLYRAFEHGRPSIETRPLPKQVKHFLESIWRRFGHHSGQHLSKVLMNHPPYVDTYNAGGRGTEITVQAMIAYYGAPARPAEGGPQSADAPGVQTVLRPRVMRSQHGKPVSVHQWMPKRVTSPAKKD